MEIEMECPTCGTLCVSSGEDDWTPVELLSASNAVAPSQSVEEAYSLWEKAPDYCPYNKRGFGAGYRAALESMQPEQTWRPLTDDATQFKRAFLGMVAWASPHGFGDEITAEQKKALFDAMVSVDGDPAVSDMINPAIAILATPQPSPTAVEACNAKRFPTPISISTDKICEIAGKYNLGNPRLDALRGFVNEVIIVNEAEYAKSE
jgi:hypothetical protein